MPDDRGADDRKTADRRTADSLAAAVATDIAAGRLRPGDRLPPQREFARRHGVAVSTAARTYRELVRRGLVVGEIGRGTFVRGASANGGAAGPGVTGARAGAPSGVGARVDLERNFPTVPGQAALMARGLSRMLRPDVFTEALRPARPEGTPAARAAAAALLTRAGWAPERLLFAGNGRQAIAAGIAALVPAGERLGVEALTYPVVRGIAARLGVALVPLPMDEAGLLPEALAAAHRKGPVRAVYLQPTLHNPLGVTMPPSRRAALAEVLREIDGYAVEDDIYGFLYDESPAGAPALAALAPERTILVDSLSKRLAPGLTVGFVGAPTGLADRLATALRTGAWTTSRFALDAATQWLTDGTVEQVAAAKRRDADERQQLVREALGDFTVHAGPGAYHCWWELPAPWRADMFVAAAARQGIAVTPGAAFAAGAGHAPNAVRLALAPPDHAELAAALTVLAGLARNGPDDAGVE